jgi:UPF0042 nucleotide-binding protein
VTVSGQPEFIVISGLSGSGKSTAVKNFEDLGAYCVDNLPTSLLPKVLELFGESTMDLRLVVIGMDIRGRNFVKGFPEIFRSLRARGLPIRLLFFTAAEKVLVRRFSETRRVHPLGGSGSLLEAIRRERKELEPLEKLADQVIDTSRTSLRDLREEVCHLARERHAPGSLSITLLSFGYKYGIPFDADLVFDVRFLPNPFFVEELKHQTGLDDPVRDFIMKKEETGKFIEEFHRFLKFLIPRYQAEGRAYLTIAIGCTGGRHRSVVIARSTAAFLKQEGGAVDLRNRDIQGD